MDRKETQTKTMARLNMLGRIYYGLVDANPVDRESDAPCDNGCDALGIVAIRLHDGISAAMHYLCPDCGCAAAESAARGMDAGATPLDIGVYR